MAKPGKADNSANKGFNVSKYNTSGRFNEALGNKVVGKRSPMPKVPRDYEKLTGK